MKEKLQRRECYVKGVQLRENSDGTPSRTIAGYAIVFNEPSVPLWEDDRETVREVIAPEAVTKELLDRSDIKLTMFHDRTIILGRSREGAGTLKYAVDAHGVSFECDLPATARGDEALEAIRRGDISGCSFAFSCEYYNPECVSIDSTTVDGHIETVATVRSIEAIHDFTLAADPAYEQTELSLREVIRERQVSAAEPEPEQGPEAETQAEAEPEAENEPETTEETNTNQEMEEQETITQSQNRERTVFEFIRENINRGLHTIEVPVYANRETTPTTPASNTVTAAAATTAGWQPVNIQGILDPLNQAVIYDKIGVPVSYSNTGKFRWLTWKGGAASFSDEGTEAVAQAVTMNNIEAAPKRITARYDISRDALYTTGEDLEGIVRKAIAMNLAALINKVLCSPTHPTGVPTTIKSPFESLTAVTLSKNPTFKEINGMKAKLLAKGVDLTGVVFIVSAATYTALEATPKDTGSGIMILQDGKMCGLPVFVSEDITDSYIGLGDFSNQPSGFFGDMSLIVDPLTRAAYNEIRFILNVGFATATVRPGAFVLGKISAS